MQATQTAASLERPTLRRYYAARLDRLHAVANEAAAYVASQRPTTRPPPAPLECEPADVHTRETLRPTNDVSADLAPLLTASLELLAAIESIDVREGDDWTENALCPCGERLAACAETFNGTCGLECVSLQLLWLHSPTQDQSPATVARTVAAIERSFAKGQR